MSTSNFSRKTVFILGALVAHVLGVSQADADPSFFPEKSKFKTEDRLKFGDLLFKDTKFQNFKNVVIDPGKGKDFIKTYDTDFTGLTKSKGVDPEPFRLTGTIKKKFMSSTPTGSWDTEILSMDLAGDIGGIPVSLKESKGFSSLGQAILTGDRTSPMMADSFFDVFFDITVDGDPPRPMEDGPARYSFLRVPEPHSMGLIAAGLFGLATYGRRRRRRRKA